MSHLSEDVMEIQECEKSIACAQALLDAVRLVTCKNAKRVLKDEASIYLNTAEEWLDDEDENEELCEEIAELREKLKEDK